MVAKISIVGVDDSVCPQDLADISTAYPFVEWGVNLCPIPEQKPAYPSAEWLCELLGYSRDMRLRGILHGRWEDDILDGTCSLKAERPDLWKKFRLLQVDIREDPKNILTSLQNYPNKIIVQINIIPLYTSNILLPKEKIYTCRDYCGYSILDSDISLICKDTSDLFWVSVSGFRSDNEITMDLEKVRSFLGNVEKFINKDGLTTPTLRKTI
jgi:hypothetical protein